MVVSAVANTTVMSMRADGRRGAAEFLDDMTVTAYSL